MNYYKLYREPGFLVFNTFKGGERFWFAYQAATHGGGAMYDEIESSQFNEILSGGLSFRQLFQTVEPRNYSQDFERSKEQKFGIRDVLDLHNLKRYVAQPVVISKIACPVE